MKAMGYQNPLIASSIPGVTLLLNHDFSAGQPARRGEDIE